VITISFYIKYKFACPVPKFKKLVGAVCTRFGLRKAVVGIVIVDNKYIRKLNEKFLRCKSVTDCLAFDLSQAGDEQKSFELVVNGQLAKSEAIKRGHPAQAELALYITHGLLHNLGFDDHSPAQARKMHRLEDQILQQHGFGPVYDRKKKIVSIKRR
jgi:probable rRNA maturation factor